MRRINRIIIHHSGVSDRIPFESIRDYHKDVLGWLDIGYHYYIEKNGILRLGRPERLIGAHVKGHNTDSIGIAVAGNFQDKVSFQVAMTDGRIDVLDHVIRDLFWRYPGAEVVCHRDLANTLCPGEYLYDYVRGVWHREVC